MSSVQCGKVKETQIALTIFLPVGLNFLYFQWFLFNSVKTLSESKPPDGSSIFEKFNY